MKFEEVLPKFKQGLPISCFNAEGAKTTYYPREDRMVKYSWTHEHSVEVGRCDEVTWEEISFDTWVVEPEEKLCPTCRYFKEVSRDPAMDDSGPSEIRVCLRNDGKPQTYWTNPENDAVRCPAYGEEE